jgi:CheY-like chemotaxis protein
MAREEAGPKMKKVLLANDLKSLLFDKNSFLDRSDIKVLTTTTNAELLKIHRQEDVDLIVTQLDAPGIKSELIFDAIRKSEDLRQVSTILICKDTLTHRERCKQCRPNAVFTIPVNTALLYSKMRQLLNVSTRKFYRTALAVAIQGNFKDRPQPFFTENISSSGMLIRSNEPLSKDDGIFFSFFLSNGTHVTGYGEITRVVPPATPHDVLLYGIRFTNIDPVVQSAIDSAINK